VWPYGSGPSPVQSRTGGNASEWGKRRVLWQRPLHRAQRVRVVKSVAASPCIALRG